MARARPVSTIWADLSTYNHMTEEGEERGEPPGVGRDDSAGKIESTVAPASLPEIDDYRGIVPTRKTRRRHAENWIIRDSARCRGSRSVGRFARDRARAWLYPSFSTPSFLPPSPRFPRLCTARSCREKLLLSPLRTIFFYLQQVCVLEALVIHHCEQYWIARSSEARNRYKFFFFVIYKNKVRSKLNFSRVSLTFR